MFLSRWCMSIIFHCVLVVPLGQICRSANHWADWVKDETYEFRPIPFCTKNKKLLLYWFIGCLMSCGASTQDLIFKIAKKHMSDSRLWRHDFWKGRSKVSLFFQSPFFFRDWTKLTRKKLPLLQFSYIFCTFGVKPLTLPPGPRYGRCSIPVLASHAYLARFLHSVHRGHRPK